MIRNLDDEAARRVIVETLDAPFRELVFSEWDADFLATPEGERGMETALVDRYLASRRHGVPWLGRTVDLARARIVEIGCGTGASTVALAERCASVVAFDVDPHSVAAAEARAAAHELTNATFEVCDPAEIIARALAVAPPPDLYVLYAVLEHLTIPERIDALRSLWEAIEPGGAVAIIETPNRLTYRDRHSSEIDFTHLLPDELAFPLLTLSPRAAYRDVIGRAARLDDADEAHVVRVRFGLGASFHEFLVAIDEPLVEIVVADGYEPEIMSWFGLELDELLLLQYMLAESIDVPCAFARSVLNVILRKPASPEERSAVRARNEARRAELADRYPLAPLGWRAEPAMSAPMTDGATRPVRSGLASPARALTARLRRRFG